MTQQNQMQMPGSFGGLMRYNDEYESSLMISPTQVILFVILVVGFVAALKMFF
jgi:preprotein translocase subunit Sec61beta